MTQTEKIKRTLERQRLENESRQKAEELRIKAEKERKEEAYRKREERRSTINTIMLTLTFLLTLLMAIMDFIVRA